MSSSNKEVLKKQRSSSKLKSCSSVLCCTGCRYSVSSFEDTEVSNFQSAPISSLAHAMVQAKLEQMIKERMVMAEYSRNEERMTRKKKMMKNKGKIDGNSKCIIMVAMDKYSYNLREDFRQSMVEVIMANRLDEPKDLRRLLDCYVSMNSIEYKPVILQVFHEVCTSLFSCK